MVNSSIGWHPVFGGSYAMHPRLLASLVHRIDLEYFSNECSVAVLQSGRSHEPILGLQIDASIVQ